MKKSLFMKLAPVTGAIALALSAHVAPAAIATATFPVTATVAANCTITAAPLAFGNYTRAVLDGTTTVTVNCNTGTTYNVGLNTGTTAGATVANRVMKSGTNSLNYTLYQETARTNIWGNTVGTDTVTGTGNGNDQPLTVYGRVFASQGAAPSGSYTDTITATITY